MKNITQEAAVKFLQSIIYRFGVSKRVLIQQKLMLFTHVASCTKSKGLSIGGPLFSKKLSLFTCVAPRTKSKGLPIIGPLFSKKLILFTRVGPRTKNKGLSIDGPLFDKTYAFYTRDTAYKKQGAPDQRSTHLLLLLARASPRTKK
jgi:hypothetical protein